MKALLKFKGKDGYKGYKRNKLYEADLSTGRRRKLFSSEIEDIITITPPDGYTCSELIYTSFPAMLKDWDII